jgi:uncharacterized protein YndB with AHSA1/START domain
MSATPQILMQFDVAAPPEEVYRALTTQAGVTSWWSTRSEVPGEVGGVVKVAFPDAPFTWDLRVDDAEPGSRLAWHCVGGPPPWIGTDIVFQLAPGADGQGTRVLFDHVGWADADAMYRIVTYGWGQVLSHLKAYAETGKPTPYADF